MQTRVVLQLFSPEDGDTVSHFFALTPRFHIPSPPRPTNWRFSLDCSCAGSSWTAIATLVQDQRVHEGAFNESFVCAEKVMAACVGQDLVLDIRIEARNANTSRYHVFLPHFLSIPCVSPLFAHLCTFFCHSHSHFLPMCAQRNLTVSTNAMSATYFVSATASSIGCVMLVLLYALYARLCSCCCFVCCCGVWCAGLYCDVCQ